MREACFERNRGGRPDATANHRAYESTTRKASPAEENRDTIEISLALDENGAGRGDFRLESSGHPAEQLRMLLLNAPHARRRNVALDSIALRYGAVDDVKIADLEPGERARPIVLTGALHLTAGVARAPGTLVLRPAELFDPWVRPLPTSIRRSPIVLRGRRIRTETARFALPAGAHLARLPASVEIAPPFSTYRASWQQEGAALVHRREWRIDRPLLRQETTKRFASTSMPSSLPSRSRRWCACPRRSPAGHTVAVLDPSWNELDPAAHDALFLRVEGQPAATASTSRTYDVAIDGQGNAEVVATEDHEGSEAAGERLRTRTLGDEEWRRAAEEFVSKRAPTGRLLSRCLAQA